MNSRLPKPISHVARSYFERRTRTDNEGYWTERKVRTRRYRSDAHKGGSRPVVSQRADGMAYHTCERYVAKQGPPLCLSEHNRSIVKRLPHLWALLRASRCAAAGGQWAGIAKQPEMLEGDRKEERQEILTGRLPQWQRFALPGLMLVPRESRSRLVGPSLDQVAKQSLILYKGGY